MKIKNAVMLATAAGLIGAGTINLDTVGDRMVGLIDEIKIDALLDFGKQDGKWRSSDEHRKGVRHTYTVKTDPNERIIGPYLDAESRTISLFGDVDGNYYVDITKEIGE